MKTKLPDEDVNECWCCKHHVGEGYCELTNTRKDPAFSTCTENAWMLNTKLESSYNGMFLTIKEQSE